MEMKQMVYVVIENGYVTGVWNEYQDAENHVGEDGVITPVVVDTYGKRAGCETPEEVIESMEQELQNLCPSCSEEEEKDEDDDDMFSSFFNDDDGDEEEEEEENDDDEETLTAADIIRGLLDMLYDD